MSKPTPPRALDQPHSRSSRTRQRRSWVGLVVAVLVAFGVFPALSGARISHTVRVVLRHAKLPSIPAVPLVFGIYPGGAAGTFGPSGSPAPEDPVKRLHALQDLKSPGLPLVLHLYASYTGPGGYSAAQQVGSEMAQYTASGFDVELVLTYRPADGGSPADVAGFVNFTQATLSAFSANPRLVSLQVTNEVNVTNAPNAADGYYAGARDALIAGVIAAKNQIRAAGASQIKVGFNWAAAGDQSESDFWGYLASHGGKAFDDAVDWVGVDVYPGTWGAPLSGSLADGTTSVMQSTLKALRMTYMPLAGLGYAVALHVSENGYPTGPARTEQMQVQAITAAVDAVNADRALYHITDYRWFDLRDADTSSPSVEDHYGLMNDDYTPKLAFDVYRSLVAKFGSPAATTASATVASVTAVVKRESLRARVAARIRYRRHARMHRRARVRSRVRHHAHKHQREHTSRFHRKHKHRRENPGKKGTPHTRVAILKCGLDMEVIRRPYGPGPRWYDALACWRLGQVF